MKKVLFILFTIIFLLHLILRVYSYKSEYLSIYNPEYWKSRYLNSQWVVPDSKESIGDDGLYAYASWEYINGRDPTTLNAELPPFGKYLIGLSILVFKNQSIFGLLSGLFALGAFYLLNLSIFKNRKLAFIPVALFSFEPLFYTQLRAPFLDLLYLGLLMATFYFLVNKKYIMSAIFFGFMVATKSSLTTIAIVGLTSLLYIFLTKNKKEVIRYIIHLPIVVFVFLASYLRYFYNGNSIWDFFGVQKWIINFYASGAKGEIFTPWWLLLTGQWHNWFGKTQAISEWHPGWAFLLVGSIVSIAWLVRNKTKSPIILVAIWVVIYLLFLTIVPMWPRYLLLLLPFMYNLLIWLILRSTTGIKVVKE